MNNKMYLNLAFNNIKKNSKTYIPYMIACIGCITMFYIMSAIAFNVSIVEIKGKDSLALILIFGNYIIGIFSSIFLFYTNSFLIKRRKKELGLYNILGMEKKHIAKVLTLEVIFIFIFTISIGLIVGVITSKLMFLVLLKILKFGFTTKFVIPTSSILITIILFLAIFFLTLLNNLRQIHLSKPIELLKGDNLGEMAEPKTKWFLTIIGVITLGLGYFIALKIESPTTAILMFFVAVILVMIGTYSLFTAGSIVILKSLRKNTKFYYKTHNFINVSGMIYRMKQNAVGLANICILSTAVLVTLSTTVSLYLGVEDALSNSFPKSISLTVYDVNENLIEKINSSIEKEADNLDIEITDLNKYSSVKFSLVEKDGKFLSLGESLSLDESNYIYDFNFITLDEYLKNNNEPMVISNDEILIFSSNQKLQSLNTFNISNKEYKIKSNLDYLTLGSELNKETINQDYIIISDLDELTSLHNSLYKGTDRPFEISYNIDFNSSASPEEEIQLVSSLNSAFNNENLSYYLDSLESSRSDFFITFGGLLFIGIFLGLLFTMATVLIMYYKQVSEGYDDKTRFEVMQKVGLSKKEIRKSISSQVSIVFFLPLVTAVIHIAFAFKMISKMLSVFNLTNTSFLLGCTLITILAFAIVYGIAYSLTAKSYYKIVSK